MKTFHSADALVRKLYKEDNDTLGCCGAGLAEDSGHCAGHDMLTFRASSAWRTSLVVGLLRQAKMCMCVRISLLLLVLHTLAVVARKGRVCAN